MVTRQFAVVCALAGPPDVGDPSPTTEELQVELSAGGLDEVVIVANARHDRLLIRGMAPAEDKDEARELVERQIYDATLDLIILEPGVWVDEGIKDGLD